MSDYLPQLDPLSTNRCPNSAPGRTRRCQPDALTLWGWCGECHQTGRVPDAWRARIEARMLNDEARRRGVTVTDLLAELDPHGGAA